MAPEAERQRRRRTNSITKSDIKNDETGVLRLSTLNGLSDTECAIDGIIYDLKSFHHPGGDALLLFGGKDATNQYRMIHPTHGSNRLDKLTKVGKVADYANEYSFGSEFERELKREVFRLVPPGKEFATPGWYSRALFYIAFFFFLQYLWITEGSSYGLATAFGIASTLIGLNVQHDANHGAVAKSHTWINGLLGFGADLIGGSKYLWMERHWTHHTFTNHHIKDPDAAAAEPFLIFRDYPIDHSARKWFHRIQVFLFPFLSSLYWVSSVTDVGILGSETDNAFLKAKYPITWQLRLMHLYITVVLPFQQHGICWSAVGHFMTFGCSGSLLLALLFTLSHNFEHVNRHPTVDASDPVCWYKAQVETSSTYGGTLSGWLTGGLNFQVEHHLFPRMSSAYYPLIAPKSAGDLQKAPCQVYVLPVGLAKPVEYTKVHSPSRKSYHSRRQPIERRYVEL